MSAEKYRSMSKVLKLSRSCHLFRSVSSRCFVISIILNSLSIFFPQLESIQKLEAQTSNPVQEQGIDPSKADLISYEEWALLLSKLILPNGEINYLLLEQKKWQSTFNSFLEKIAHPLSQNPHTPPPSKEALLAYWINAYNALTIRHVLRFPRLESVASAVHGKPRYTFFKQRVHRVNGKLYSLDDIEHEIIRKTFKDPRIHMALNCASTSCPPLPKKPFYARNLMATLDDLAVQFVNDPSRQHLTESRLNISKIFYWYHEDFATSHDRQRKDQFAGVRDFITKYWRGSLSVRQVINSKEIYFKPYDWSLSGPAPQVGWLEVRD